MGAAISPLNREACSGPVFLVDFKDTANYVAVCQVIVSQPEHLPLRFGILLLKHVPDALGVEHRVAAPWLEA